jgi:fructose-1,6-bisphosphatase
VHYDATPMAYMVHDADGKLLAESGDRLDAMLTALEADGETKGASDES